MQDRRSDFKSPILQPHTLRGIQCPCIWERNITTPAPEHFAWRSMVTWDGGRKYMISTFVDYLASLMMNPTTGPWHASCARTLLASRSWNDRMDELMHSVRLAFGHLLCYWLRHGSHAPSLARYSRREFKLAHRSIDQPIRTFLNYEPPGLLSSEAKPSEATNRPIGWLRSLLHQ